MTETERVGSSKSEGEVGAAAVGVFFLVLEEVSEEEEEEEREVEASTAAATARSDSASSVENQAEAQRSEAKRAAACKGFVVRGEGRGGEWRVEGKQERRGG